MKVIQIEGAAFDRIFEETLKDLELETLKERRGIIDPKFNTRAEVESSIIQLYRRFHYEVHRLKDKLEKA